MVTTAQGKSENTLDWTIRRLLITCEVISAVSFVRTEGEEVRFYNTEKDRRWWRTGKSGVLQSMGLQKVRYNCAAE